MFSVGRLGETPVFSPASCGSADYFHALVVIALHDGQCFQRLQTPTESPWEHDYWVVSTGQLWLQG